MRSYALFPGVVASGWLITCIQQPAMRIGGESDAYSLSAVFS